MDAFRLNKSDYKIVASYLLVATIWLIINFYIENYTLVEYVVDIPVFWLQTVALLYVTKELINTFLIKHKNYSALLIFTVLSFWFFGFLASMSGEITRSGTINWNKLPSFFELIFLNINSSAANLAIPLAVLSAKKH